MPQEWPDEMFTKLCYKTPDSRMLEVAVLQADDSLVLHWCPFDPSDSQTTSEVQSTTLSAAGYFSDSQNGAEAYVKGQLKELIDKFAPSIDLILQVLLPQTIIYSAHFLHQLAQHSLLATCAAAIYLSWSIGGSMHCYPRSC